MECSYKNRSHCENISKEKIRRHVFVVYVLTYICNHCQNLEAIGQIPYEFQLFTVSASSEIKGSCEQLMDECYLVPLFQNEFSWKPMIWK